MANELAIMADGIINLNTNINAIKDLMTNDTLKKINENNNIRNDKSSISDSIDKMSQSVIATKNTLKDNIKEVYTKVNTTIKKPNLKKIVDKTDSTPVKTEIASKQKFYDKVLDYLGMSSKYYKSELDDKTKQQKTSFFQNGMNKAIGTKDRITSSIKDFKDPMKNSLNGLTLAGLSLYALYEAFSDKVGKWTGTIKLMGKTLLKTASMMLSPLSKFTKSIFSAISPKFLTNGLNSISKQFTGAIGSMIKPFTTLTKKGLLKTVGVKNFKMISKFLAKGGKVFGKSALKKIPIIGALMGLGFGAKRFMEGDISGGLLEIGSGVASLVPGVGTAMSIGIDLLLARRDYVRGDNYVNKPVKLQFKDMFTKLKDKVMKTYPISQFIYGFKAFKNFASGNFKDGLEYAKMSYLSTPIIGDAISYIISLDNEKHDTTATIKESKFEINNTIKKQLNNTNKKVSNNITKGLNGLNKDLDNVVTSSFSDNVKYINKRNIDKLNKKKEKDEKTELMIDELKTISKAVVDKNEFDKSKERTERIFNNKNGIK